MKKRFVLTVVIFCNLCAWSQTNEPSLRIVKLSPQQIILAVSPLPPDAAYTIQYSVDLKNWYWATTFAGQNREVSLTLKRYFTPMFFRLTQGRIPPQLYQSPRDQMVEWGSPALFNVLVGGTEPMRYLWFGPDQKEIVTETDVPELRIARTDFHTIGRYWVTVSNAYGSVTSSSAHLRTLPLAPPVIVLAPTPRSCFRGHTAKLFVIGTGIELTYQWGFADPYFDLGSGWLVGETNSVLTLNNVQSNQVYEVLVFDAVFQKVHATVSLNVIESFPMPRSVAGKSATLTIQGGASPFLTSGAYQMTISADGLSYIATALGFSSSGACSYSVGEGNQATLLFNDPWIGLITSHLEFAAPTSGGFFNERPGQSGWSTGYFAIEGNNDRLPALSIVDQAATEGNGSRTVNVVFTVSLSAVSSLPVTVDYSTSSDTALAGLDFVATSGTLAFAPGETNKTIAVAVRGDTIAEATESFFLNLSNAANASISDSQGVGFITDDDSP